MIPRMNAAVPTPRRPPLPHTDAGASIRDWVDALAGGSCSSAQFLGHVRELGREDSEPIWEALALLDQSVRSRRIPREIFLPIKSNLQQFALKFSQEAVPPPPAATTSAAAEASPAAETSPAPVGVGSVLRGRYRVIGVLGTGTAGKLVEAIDEMRADVPDALQRIAIRILDSGQLQDPGQVSAYLRHVCVLQSLSHPNLLRVFDFDQDQGRPFLTMELLAGSSLPRLLSPTESALRYQIDLRHVLGCLAGALQCAHAQGITHGDLSADDVFITVHGDVRLLGLDKAFTVAADAIARDHLAFAWLVRDLLGSDSNPERLRRPRGLTNKQWWALEAVILGRESEGPKLLQAFAEPVRAAAAYGSLFVGRTKWLWSLLLICVAGGAAYLARDRLDLKSWFAEPAAGAAALPAPESMPSARRVEVARAVESPPPAAVPPAAAEPAESPASRISIINLAQSALRVEDGDTVARVRVVRSGNIASRAEFIWWTESGSAESGVDYYAVTPRGANFPANRATVDLFVPLVANASRTEPVTFYVKVDEAGAGATLGVRTLAQVTVVPVGYVPPPAGEQTSP